MKDKFDLLVQVAKQAKVVREKQRAYFADRTKEKLVASKAEERKLDRMIDDLGDPESALGLLT